MLARKLNFFSTVAKRAQRSRTVGRPLRAQKRRCRTALASEERYEPKFDSLAGALTYNEDSAAIQPDRRF